MRGTDRLVPLPDAGAGRLARRSLNFASVCLRLLSIRSFTTLTDIQPFKNFSIRWRDLADPTTAIHHYDISGFVTMDGYELGGRVIKARTYAPAIFSRIATSPTSCLPLSFANLPRSAGQSTFRSHCVS